MSGVSHAVSCFRVCLFLTHVRRTQEIMLPYALDARHAPDTPFIVSECDFRFYKADCKDNEEAWGDQLAEHMWEVGQAALDRALRAVEETAERSRRNVAKARAPSPSPAAEEAGTRRRAPSPSPAAGPASSSHRAPSPSPAETRDSSPEGRGVDLLTVLRTVRTEMPPASAPTGDAIGAASASGEPSPSPSDAAWEAAKREVRKAFLDARTREEGDDSFFGWQRSCPPSEPSPELRDLVRVCTAAHRIGRGNFVWLAWEGANTSRSMPSHGTTLVAFTRSFAAAFLEHLNQTKEVHHLDLMLLEWLKTGHNQVQHRACFLYPACGSYLKHVSGCEAGLGVRESSWASTWIGEGFRCAERGRRYLGAWQKKGGAEWKAGPLNLDDVHLVWRTERPPSAWDDVRWSWRLWNRGWLDEHWGWVGPPLPRSWSSRDSGASQDRRGRSQAGQPSPSPAAQWNTALKAWQGTMQQLREDPDGYRQLRGSVYAPITRLAEELVTDPQWLDSVGAPEANSRVGRHRRAAISAYLRRYFVDDGQAAFFVRAAEPLASQ